jgi:long-chain fatty acid transport protein
MRNNLLKITTLSVVASSMLMANGWRLPEQSAKSVALSGAYVANASGASASYFNPANMSFNPDVYQGEASLMYIKLPSITYADNRIAVLSGESKSEKFFVPTIFVSSKDMNGLRYGFSVTAPGGLSKRWSSPYQKLSAEEFTLKIVELNPSISYAINSKLALGAGLRAVYTDGIVKSDGTIPKGLAKGMKIKRDMKGDSWDFGYNLALTYKLQKDTNLAITYRSNIDLTVKGDAKLYANGAKMYDGGTSVTIPLPAVLALAVSHKFNKTTVELEYDKTYWSEYKNLDFNYSKPVLHPVLKDAFDNPKPKNWSDTDAFRLGISHEVDDDMTLMFGCAIDENPAPTKNIGFELPDSDAKLYSFGLDYKLDNKSSIGFGYLLDIKKKRTVNNSKINGTFTNVKAHLVSFAYRMSF